MYEVSGDSDDLKASKIPTAMVNACNEPDRQLFHCTYTDVIKIPSNLFDIVLLY